MTFTVVIARSALARRGNPENVKRNIKLKSYLLLPNCFRNGKNVQLIQISNPTPEQKGKVK
jgi:hypothetical protein